MSDRNWERPLLLDDGPVYDVPEEWRTVVTSDGEIVELHPDVAKLRMMHKLAYEQRRLAYCETHHKDPETFGQRSHECVDCGGTGKAFANNLPCHCPQSRSLIAWIAKQEDAVTNHLIEKLCDPKWLTSNQDRSEK